MRLASQTLGRRLAQIRADRRMTQEVLGTALDKSRQAITHWENDPFFEVRLSDAQACAEGLGRRLRELLGPFDAPIPRIPRGDGLQMTFDF